MDIETIKAAMEAILFAAGREVKITEFMSSLELSEEEAISILNSLASDYNAANRGVKIIRMEDSYQMASKKEFYNYIYPILDKRNKPNLSNAALETLAIIAYNPKITRSQIEEIRGVNSDGAVYKLLEYGLIEDAGRMNAPGKPVMYKTNNEFLKKFGYSSLAELPELPKYKLDENEQIVLDEFEEPEEAPMPGMGTEENLNQEHKYILEVNYGR